jgi:UDP-N-acetylmuramoyl-tripeptide--D-alanyl-D-alanine ligase
MSLWTSTDAAAATGGYATTQWTADGVSIDTRTLQPGDLFVALKDVRDGHDFVAQALEKGAAAALVTYWPDDVADDAPLLIVDDVLAGLTDLGRAARARTKAKVLGITGSVGKTSTKEMLRTMLDAQSRVHAAEKSYNNHWGVPLTLARMPMDCDYAIIEIGMNHPGEIAPLAILADLDAAMITIVAPAHLEAFTSVDEISVEKAAIFQGLRAHGIAVINGDLPTTGILTDAARDVGAEITCFGHGDAATARITELSHAQGMTIVQAVLNGTPVLFKLATTGAHFALNALGALALAEAAGADLARCILALGAWKPVDGRGVSETLLLDEGIEDTGFQLIDDAYNANPASVGAALDMLAITDPEDGLGRVSKGRRIAILGDMLELGPTEAQLHADLAAHPAMQTIAKVHCVGTRMKSLWDAVPETQRGLWVATSDELATEIRRIVDAGDVVLVKGSLGSRLAVVVDAIRKLGHSRRKEK